MQDTNYYPTINCDYSTDVEDSDSEEEEEENNNNNNRKKQQQQQAHSPYRHIEKIFKDYEKVQKEFSELNKRLQSKSCTKEDKLTIIDRLEELTALTQSLQEEYKLSIKWNKMHGLSSEGITDKNNTPIDKNNNKYNNDDEEEDDDNYRTISDITDDLNQVDVLYNSFKETLKKCKVSNWSRNMLHILQKRFDDLTEELNHTKLHIKSDMKLSEHSRSDAIDLLNQLDYYVRSAEKIHNNINSLNNNKEKEREKEEEKDKMKKIYMEINLIVKSLLACEDIQNTEFITVVQGISSNVKSISPAYDILKQSIMKLKKLLENNYNNNNQSTYDALKFNNNYSYNKEIQKPITRRSPTTTSNNNNNSSSTYSTIINNNNNNSSNTSKSTSNIDENSIGKLLKEAEYVQEQYNLLKDELNGNPSPQRIMEIQSLLTELMRRANSLESSISTIRTSVSSGRNTISNNEDDREEEENNDDFTPLGIEKRLTVLSEKYEELCQRIKNCKNDKEKESLRYEIGSVLEETRLLNERITQMKPEEKDTIKNQLQTILINGVKACREECSGREEKYGFLTDYYKKYLPITSDKMLKEFVDLGMKLCSTEML